MLLLLLLILALLLPSCAAAAPPNDARPPGLPSHWHKGFHYTGWWKDVYQTPQATTSWRELMTTGLDSVSVMTTWYQATLTSNSMAPDPDRTPTDEGVLIAIRRAKAAGLRVFLRPFVDTQAGVWRGNIDPANTAAWFAAYERMLLRYARMAAEEDVDMLQVGLEYRSLTRAANDARWRSLIAKVRDVYDGRLTYAANWDEFEAVSWWDALDVIGIDAAFPLATPRDPSVSQIVQSWEPHVSAIDRVRRRFDKPVVFTELGYRSEVGTLAAPFRSTGPYDPDEQRRGLEAAFRVFRDKPWFRGVYIWQWKAGQAPGSRDRDHTPRGKPAARTVRAWYRSPSPARR